MFKRVLSLAPLDGIAVLGQLTNDRVSIATYASAISLLVVPSCRRRGLPLSKQHLMDSSRDGTLDRFFLGKVAELSHPVSIAKSIVFVS